MAIEFPLEEANSLNQVKNRLLEHLTEYKLDHPDTKIWFITGIIGADGEDLKQRNKARLRFYSERVRSKLGLTAFSAADVFDTTLVARVKLGGDTSEDFTPMWCELIDEAKNLLTGIILTPRWSVSSGCVKEVDAAIKAGIKILDLEKYLLTALVSQENNPHN